MKPLVTSNEAPEDYVNEFKRGTVEYTPEWRNYSHHIVIIPDKTIVVGCNFMQLEPKTEAIIGKNLTFIDCNLTNVEVDPSWSLVRSNNAQCWRLDTGKREHLGKTSFEVVVKPEKPDGVIKMSGT